MSNQGYVVTAPYITVRVKDDVGSEVIQGFYAGSVLPEDVNDDDLDKHLRKEMVAEQGSKEADRATPYGQPVSFDDYGNPLTPAQAEEREQQRAERRQSRGRTSTSAADSKPSTDSKPSPVSAKTGSDPKATTGNA